MLTQVFGVRKGFGKLYGKAIISHRVFELLTGFLIFRLISHSKSFLSLLSVSATMELSIRIRFFEHISFSVYRRENFRYINSYAFSKKPKSIFWSYD